MYWSHNQINHNAYSSKVLVEVHAVMYGVWFGVCLKVPIEPVHEISNNVVCATSKASDQPAHKRSLIRAFASRLSIL